jgi:hypothetical protein
VYLIEGATQILTINQAHLGRSITLIPLAALPGNLLGTGGNIATVVAGSQNVPIRCDFFNTLWYCK